MHTRVFDVQVHDGRRVSVWEGGDPAGVPVVFFHGCPDSRRAAVPGDAAAREMGVRLVAMSRPGYSNTDLPVRSGAGVVTGFEHLEVADDTVEVADLLGVGEFGVLGMSVGGPYAVATAARHPGRVRSLGVVEAPAQVPLLNPPVHRDDLTDSAAGYFGDLAQASAAEAAEQMRPEFESYVAGIDPRDPDDVSVARRWLDTLPAHDAELVAPRGPSEIAAVAREALSDPRGYLRDAAVTFRPWQFRVEAVTSPVFAWYGDGDDTYSLRNGEWYADALGATLAIQHGGSHLGALLEQWPQLLGTLIAA